MPKVKSLISRKNSIAAKFQDGSIVCEAGIVFCVACSIKLGSVSEMCNSRIVQHICTSKHKRNHIVNGAIENIEIDVDFPDSSPDRVRKPTRKRRTFSEKFKNDSIVIEDNAVSCIACSTKLGDLPSIRRSQISQHIRTRKHRINQGKDGSNISIELVPLEKRDRIEEFAIESIVADEDSVLCTACCSNLGSASRIKKSQITQHIKSSKHKHNRSLEIHRSTFGSTDDENTFSTELCQAFVCSGIPLSKLNNEVLREFLEKYTGRRILTEATIRKNYIEDTYKAVIDCIRHELGNDPIWLSVDETNEIKNRCMVNVVVGSLSSESAKKAHLLHTEQISTKDSQTFVTLINNALSLLWPNGIKYNRVFLLITKGYEDVVQAASDLSSRYTNMLHIVCLLHSLHQVADQIRQTFSGADTLISSLDRIFSKPSVRDRKLLEIFPDLSPPPTSTMVRLHTWLFAVKYYSTNWKRIKEFLYVLDEDSAALNQVRQLFENDEVFAQVSFIYEHYMFIFDAIIELDSPELPLRQSLSILKNVLSKSAATPKKSIREKLIAVLNVNVGLKALSAIESNNMTALKQYEQFADSSPADIAAFKYARLTCFDVEHNYDSYRRLLGDRSRTFSPGHLTYYLVISCNKVSDLNFVKEEPLGDFLNFDILCV